MKFRKQLTKITIVSLLIGLVVVVFLFVRPSDKGINRLNRAIYQNWKASHSEVVRDHGVATDFKFVTIWFQVFSDGYIAYSVTDSEAFVCFDQTKSFRKVLTPSGNLTPGPHAKVNEELLQRLLDHIPPEEREQYKSLVYEGVRDGGVGIVGGIGSLYLDEKLLHDLGKPLFNEKRFDNVLYAKGRDYELLIGLPIGGEDPFAPDDWATPRKVSAFYYNNSRFKDYHELPATYEGSFPFPQVLAEYYQEYHQRIWFWPLSVLTTFFTAYILGMGVLLLLARQRGSMVFSRTWLISVAAKPLLIAPGLGRRVLFLGFEQRLANHKAIKQVSTDYFGLPAEDAMGLIPPDSTGEQLHDRIARALGPQQPVLVLGKGGAGKSTVLSRLTHLALEDRLPDLLQDFIPLLIPASYYTQTLTQAIADTLRARDGVAVTEEIVKAQLQSGRFLILFDGVSEVISPKQTLTEIIRTAQHSDYRSCRFIISTRPLDSVPTGVSIFQLHPLTFDIIDELLTHSKLEIAHRNHVIKQMRYFGQKPIAPLLFSMIMERHEDQHISSTRSQVYERYFRELLGVREDDTLWLGWQKALETLALHTLIETGRRGVGLPHEYLMNLIGENTVGSQTIHSLSNQLYRLYRLQVRDELDLLNQLVAAGLLHGGRRWRFAHDTFEEFFAASYIVSYLDLSEKLPSLDKWKESKEQEQAFCDVIEFVQEILNCSSQERLMNMDLPHRWKIRLMQNYVPAP
jgi:hypothetical protein